MLTAAELQRYARQIVLPELGVAGQDRLRESRVLIVGAGGLGSPVALYLAAAGVGTIGIVDSDTVEVSNLHRQILHETADVGGDKSLSAAAAIRRLNPHVDVRAYQERFGAPLAGRLVGEYDVVVDGSDNYPTRYLVNDACAAAGVPWVYGSVERFAGQVSVFGFANGPCYRCVYPEPPEPGASASCEEIGVLGAVPGVVGSIQATEALKLLLGIGVPLSGRLLQLDLLRGELRTIVLERRPDCATCGAAGGSRRPEERSEVTNGASSDIEPGDLARLADGERAPRLIDVREPWEWEVARIAGARHLPLDQLEREAATLDPNTELVVYCHHGTRSAAAVHWLRARGFRARNLAGGIDRWSREIDAAVPRY